MGMWLEFLQLALALCAGTLGLALFRLAQSAPQARAQRRAPLPHATALLSAKPLDREA